MQPLDRPGRFRSANPRPIGLAPARDSKSVSAIIEFPVTEMFDESTGEWIPWEYDQGITGYIVIVKKDGEPNANQVESLIKNLRWNGDLTKIAENSDWQPNPCQITVEENTYNGRTSLKVNWINEWDYEGGIKKADDATVKGLANQYGAKFRALAGNVARNAPAGKPPAKAKPVRTAAPVGELPGAPADDIPF